MKVTFLGHSTFSIQTGEKTVVLDPFVTPNQLANSIEVASIKADYVLLSHGHQDHLYDAETIARNNDAVVISSFEIASYYGAKGLKYHPMNTGGSKDFGEFKVKAVNAIHSSSLPDGMYAGNPMGFIISSGGKNIYYSGDTALTLDMQLIPLDFSIDTALLCMGDNFTMGPADALRAAGFVKTKKVIGMHFDTFPYILIDHASTIATFNNAGVELILPAIGQTIEI
ncbi:MAG: metal-dependent hydrolase [Crocinitomicaceae bacterium]|nr:metal-dependent hydrolase [Crocinitomicaceae bacterium]